MEDQQIEREIQAKGGESACASPENFNAEIGRKVARQHAVEKIWALEGYLLKYKLAGGKTFSDGRAA